MTSPTHPIKPLYLFFGNQHEAVLKARDEVVEQLVPREFRDSNLSNYYATGNSPKISLAGVIDEIAGDLATLSFFPGASKAVIVTNPDEVFTAETNGENDQTAGKKRRGKPEFLLKWLEQELPQTGNHLILLALEEEGTNRGVNDRQPNALFKLAQKIGHVRFFRDKPALFKIEDALLQRDLNTLLAAVRDLWSSKTDQIIFNKICSVLRFSMQANIARERKLSTTEAAANALFPTQAQGNLFKAHWIVQKKYEIPLFRTADLIKAHQQLLEVYRAMRPRPGDIYVPDSLGLLEHSLRELISAPGPRR